MDEQARDDVSWDPLNVRLSRGPEVSWRDDLNSLITHHESFTFWVCGSTCSAMLPSFARLDPPGSVQTHDLQCVSHVTQNPFAAVKYFLCLCCSCSCSSCSPFLFSGLGQWVNVSFINHFILCQSFGLTQRCRRDRHCFKKWSAHDATYTYR